MSKVIGEQYGIEITRPWSKEMYDHNDTVLAEMKANIKSKIDEFVKMDQMFCGLNEAEMIQLKEFAKCISAYGYGQGCNTTEYITKDLYKNLEHAEKWWLHQEYPYLVEKGFVPALEKYMVGFKS